MSYLIMALSSSCPFFLGKMTLFQYIKFHLIHIYTSLFSFCDQSSLLIMNYEETTFKSLLIPLMIKIFQHIRRVHHSTVSTIHKNFTFSNILCWRSFSSAITLVFSSLNMGYLWKMDKSLTIIAVYLWLIKRFLHIFLFITIRVSSRSMACSSSCALSPSSLAWRLILIILLSLIKGSS